PGALRRLPRPALTTREPPPACRAQLSEKPGPYPFRRFGAQPLWTASPVIHPQDTGCATSYSQAYGRRLGRGSETPTPIGGAVREWRYPLETATRSLVGPRKRHPCRQVVPSDETATPGSPPIVGGRRIRRCDPPDEAPGSRRYDCRWMADGSFPTGTVTFLLTDVEGSTGIWETEPARARI